MKKLFTVLLALVMMLLSAVSALAENPAEMLVDAAEELLFRTENVTLTGQATFFLDDVVFKVAEAVYVQDGERSYWQLKLRTPREGLPDLESGYTIIADDVMVYVMEAVYPGVYKTATTYPQSTILRRSVQLDLMVRLVEDLAKQADSLLGEDAITEKPGEKGGTDIRIVLDENVPDLVHTVLNVLYQYTARRYFSVDFDQINDRYMSPIGNYETVTQGILSTTQYMYLKQADVTVQADIAGHPEHIEGAAAVYLQTGGDGEHTLDVTFSLDVSGWGTSKVESFDPEKYGVVPANAFSEPDNALMAPEESEKWIDAGKAFIEKAGFGIPEEIMCSLYTTDGLITLVVYDDEGAVHLTCKMTQDGIPVLISNDVTNYGVDAPLFLLEKNYEDKQMVADAADRLLQFLADVNPEAAQRVQELELDFWFSEDGFLYFIFEEYPHQYENGVSFVVRVQPEWRIEDYCAIGMG